MICISELLRSANWRRLLFTGGGSILGFIGELKAISTLLGLLSGRSFLPELWAGIGIRSSFPKIWLLCERWLNGERFL